MDENSLKRAKIVFLEQKYLFFFSTYTFPEILLAEIILRISGVSFLSYGKKSAKKYLKGSLREAFNNVLADFFR